MPRTLKLHRLAWIITFLLITTTLLITAGLVGRSALAAGTITVNSTADLITDDGFCTLREAIIAALAIAYRFVWLDPPAWDDALTIADVRGANDAREHETRVRAWAASVWRAWAPHHAAVRAWADLAGVRG